MKLQDWARSRIDDVRMKAFNQYLIGNKTFEESATETIECFLEEKWKKDMLVEILERSQHGETLHEILSDLLSQL